MKSIKNLTSLLVNLFSFSNPLLPAEVTKVIKKNKMWAHDRTLLSDEALCKKYNLNYDQQKCPRYNVYAHEHVLDAITESAMKRFPRFKQTIMLEAYGFDLAKIKAI